MVDDPLIELAQQCRADAEVPPLRVQRQGHQMCVGPPTAGDDRADKPAFGDRNGGGLVLVECLDDVATAVGRSSGRACCVDQADDLLERCDRFPVVDRNNPPGGAHTRHCPAVQVALLDQAAAGGRTARRIPDSFARRPLLGEAVGAAVGAAVGEVVVEAARFCVARVLWCSLECTPACQAGGRGFKSRQDRRLAR